jgi:hypothetical protein
MATAEHGLSDFLIRLGDDPDLFAEYVRDREGVLMREGLTPAERDAVLSGGLLEIRAAIRSEDAGPEKRLTIMDPEPGEPPTIMEPEPGEPPTIMEPEPGEPPTIMEPEPGEPPTIMDPEEPKQAD